MSISQQIPDGSIYLSAKKPITVDVDNAVLIGLNESIVLSQIRYWIEDTGSGQVVDGERWVYNTHKGWRDSNFPFWSVATTRRAISALEDMGLIKSRDDLNPKRSDRTKWYTINFDHSAYGQGVSSPSAQNEQAMCSKRAGHVLKMSNSSIAETTTETTTGKSDTDFDKWYEAYPKKVGKGAARKAFAKAIKSESLDTLISAVERQRNSEQWAKDGGQFIPNPATWLNQERWDDSLPSSKSPQPGTDGIPAHLYGTDRIEYARNKWREENPEDAQRWIEANPEEAKNRGWT